MDFAASLICLRIGDLLQSSVFTPEEVQDYTNRMNDCGEYAGDLTDLRNEICHIKCAREKDRFIIANYVMRHSTSDKAGEASYLRQITEMLDETGLTHSELLSL